MDEKEKQKLRQIVKDNEKRLKEKKERDAAEKRRLKQISEDNARRLKEKKERDEAAAKKRLEKKK